MMTTMDFAGAIEIVETNLTQFGLPLLTGVALSTPVKTL